MNDRLAKAIDRLRNETAKAGMPPETEHVLLTEFSAEFDRVTSRNRRRQRSSSWMLAAGAVAASIAIVLMTFSIREHRPHLEPPASSAAVPENVPGSEQGPEQGFVPIPYVSPLMPYERAEIVRMEMPVAALIAAGLPMRTADPGARAEADVVVGQDGRARAVRLVSISAGGE